jgi:RNA polymerase sigma-70 factor (ECF subfamily)
VGEASNVASPAGWLYRLAVRKSLLHRRKAGRERRRFSRVARESASQQEQRDPLQWLLADERAEQVRAALERLTDRERELLLLKYTEDWSYQQMAEHLGLSASAVESRLHRARQRLRDQLRTLNTDE